MTLKKAGAWAGSITAILILLGMGVQGALWAGDQRYVMQQTLTTELRRMRLEDRLAAVRDQIDNLSDEAEFRQLKPIERARLNRLMRRRDALIQELK